MGAQVKPRVRRIELTEPIAAGRQYHYADAFEVRLSAPDTSSPEQWLRAGFDSAPAVVDWIASLLSTGSDASSPSDELDGWRIVASTPEVIHLEQSDSLMDVVMVGRRAEPTRRVLTTVLSYKRPILARLLFAVIRPAHRWMARRIVTSGMAHPPGIEHGVVERAS